MRAARVHRGGGPDAIVVEDVAMPSPGPRAVRIELQAAGVNYIDTIRRTDPSTVPTGLGSEAAGVIDQVGEEVRGHRPGDRVVTTAAVHAYAEHAIADAAKLIPIPDDITSAQAAAVTLQGMTAHYLSHAAYALVPGDVAVVHAAAGGVGHLLVQIARMRGARVIGVTSTPAKVDRIAATGVLGVICTQHEPLADGVHRLTGGEGAHVVYDGVGGATFAAGLKALRPRGTMVLYGIAGGPVESVDLSALATGSLSLVRPSLRHYTGSTSELLARAADLFTWISAGQLVVEIDHTYSLDDAASAHRRLESRDSIGKILICP